MTVNDSGYAIIRTKIPRSTGFIKCIIWLYEGNVPNGFTIYLQVWLYDGKKVHALLDLPWTSLIVCLLAVWWKNDMSFWLYIGKTSCPVGCMLEKRHVLLAVCWKKRHVGCMLEKRHVLFAVCWKKLPVGCMMEKWQCSVGSNSWLKVQLFENPISQTTY